ncbi:MAG: hypothetical protein ACT4O1_06540 [Gemmatimonadota bacterium]
MRQQKNSTVSARAIGVCLAFAVLSATPAHAQCRVAVALSFGGAGGAAFHPMAGVEVSVNVQRSLAGFVHYHWFGEHPSSCTDQPETRQYRCSFRGRLVLTGSQYNVPLTRSTSLVLRAGAGLFKHSDNFVRTNELAVSGGLELNQALGRIPYLLAGYRAIRIFDDEYKHLVGEAAMFHAVVVGAGVHF